jgi:AcrR family transcriptional regulator
MEESGLTQKHRSSESASNVLEPKTPADIGARSQRRRIVDAMVASCAEKSYAETTISDIVARARISRTTFYKRFGDKRECFDAALELCIEQVRDAAAASHSTADPPAEAARKAAVAVVDLLASQPNLAQFLAGEAHAVEPAVLERYRGLLLPALEGLWSANGNVPDPRVDPRLAFGRAQVLILNQIADPESADLHQLLFEFVYLTVAPFAGHDEALAQARLAQAEGGGDGR